MIQKIEDSTREQIALFLPIAIAKAAASYHDFMEEEKEPDVSKKFAEHHKACRVAIAHLELLLKLARWADLPAEAALKEIDRLSGMMSEAEANHTAFIEQEAEGEDLA